MANQEMPGDATTSFEPFAAALQERHPVSARDIVIQKPPAENESAEKVASTATMIKEEGDAVEAEGNQVPSSENTSDKPGGGQPTSKPGNQLARASEITVAGDFSLVLTLVRERTGATYICLPGSGNPQCFRVRSNECNKLIRRLAYLKDRLVTDQELKTFNMTLEAAAEVKGATAEVWYRVARTDNGVEIDLGDESNTRVRITPGTVDVVTEGSPTLFYRTPIARAMAMPSDRGDLNLLKKYLNLSDVDILLLEAWLSFTLAHPKVQTANFPILVLQGEQGAGKTSLCRTIQALIDPNNVGVQVLPTTPKDLAIAGQNAHVLAYDNVRGFSQTMADALCIAATGGALSSRELYSDAGQAVQRLHVALILNGIHDFVNQPDLAQRCLPIHLKPFPAGTRRSEAEIAGEFQADLPAIMRGLFDLIASVLVHLTAAAPVHQHRMIDFTRWLAAMEAAFGIPGTPFQDAYADALSNIQRESLLDSPLAAAVLAFAATLKDRQWSGTPSALLDKLDHEAEHGAENWKYWPKNPNALTKRLKPLMGGLREQGVDIALSRGKQRCITIKVTEEFDRG